MVETAAVDLIAVQDCRSAPGSQLKCQEIRSLDKYPDHQITKRPADGAILCEG